MIEKKPVDLEDEEFELVELYLALMTKLNRSRTVVELRKKKGSGGRVQGQKTKDKK